MTYLTSFKCLFAPNLSAYQSSQESSLHQTRTVPVSTVDSRELSVPEIFAREFQVYLVGPRVADQVVYGKVIEYTVLQYQPGLRKRGYYGSESGSIQLLERGRYLVLRPIALLELPPGMAQPAPI
jgi:hypothetical protein